MMSDELKRMANNTYDVDVVPLAEVAVAEAPEEVADALLESVAEAATEDRVTPCIIQSSRHGQS